MTTRIAAGQVSTAAAEVYEKDLVPALFGQWATPMLDAVQPQKGDRLADVGAGTGVVARAALQRVGPDGSVLAIDPNEGMLAVAQRLAPQLSVRRGVAEALPVGDAEVDCLICQFVLMFCTDRVCAIAEMARVCRPGGRVAVATWAAIDQLPGFAAMAELFAEVLGDWAAEAMRAPFAIGTADELDELLRTSFPDVTVERHAGQACFPSLDRWLDSEIHGWTLAEHVDAEQFETLRRRAAGHLDRFVAADGTVRFPAPALIAIAPVR